MRRFRWDYGKNIVLQRTRGIGFEEIVAAIEAGGLLDTVKHHDLRRYPRQQLLIVALHDYAYVVPYVEEEDGTYFLKTVYPSRNMTEKYLQKSGE